MNQDIATNNSVNKSDNNRHYLVPWKYQQSAPQPSQFVRGKGPWLFDVQNKRTFDLSSGWIAANLGHGIPEITRAIADESQKLSYLPPIFANEKRSQLCRMLSDLSPWPEGARTHLVTGGGEAMDDALKIARMLTGRHKIMAAYRSYHGTTLGASGVTGDKRRWVNEPAAQKSIRFFAPYPYRSPFYTESASEEVERAIDHLELTVVQEGASSIAAIVLEPVVGSSGLIVYPAEYLKRVRQFADQHGILLIFDEVMTGFGRVGEAFAAVRFDVSPDMIVFGKGVNGGTLPLGGVILPEALAAMFDQDILFDAGHTHAGHPVVAASGVAALEYFQKYNLFKRAYSIETVISQTLNTLRNELPVVGDVRGIGAFWGIELVSDKKTKSPLVGWYSADTTLSDQITSELLKRGVWAMCRYSIIMIAPPLVSTDEEIMDALEIIKSVLTNLT